MRGHTDSAATKRRKRTPKRAAELLSDEEYDRLLAEQEGGCAICGNTAKRPKKDGTTYRLMVDHNHRTHRVRGLLCFRCNRALPTYVTSEWLRLAFGYVVRDEYPDLDVPDQWLEPLDQWADAR